MTEAHTGQITILCRSMVIVFLTEVFHSFPQFHGKCHDSISGLMGYF
jgi:hypothetical protein